MYDCITIAQCIDMTMYWIDELYWFFSSFPKMSSIKVIFFPIKTYGKAIDATYQSWIEIQKLIQKYNDNRKKFPKVGKDIFVCFYYHVSISSKIQLNHRQAIQGYNETLDEKCNKLVFKPYHVFKFNQGKRNVGLQLEISWHLKKHLGRRKDEIELKTIGGPQGKYTSH